MKRMEAIHTSKWPLIHSRDGSLTRNTESGHLSNSGSCFHPSVIDEEFFVAQLAGDNKNKNNPGLLVPHHAHPLPWSVLFAFAGIAASLTMLMYFAIMGGLDLG